MRPERSVPADQLVQLAAWCAYISALASVFGILFLLAFFTLGGVFGLLNDIAVIVQYALMVPIGFALYGLFRSHNPRLGLIGLSIGMVGMFAVIILQGLLVAGVLPFSQQIGMVVPAFMMVLAWFLINRYLGRAMDVVPKSLLLTLLAGLYIAYPFWGFALGKRLKREARFPQRGAG